MKRNIKAILFDLDGVILTTDHYHFLAWKMIADEIGADFNETDNERLRGVSRMESLEIVLEKYHGTPFTDEQKVLLPDSGDIKTTVYVRRKKGDTIVDWPVDGDYKE